MASLPPKPQRPPLTELAPREDPLNPLRINALRATPYTELLTPDDSILQSKGGIDNLRIYRELLRDDQVASVWAQRRLALTSCETAVEPGAEDPLSVQAAEALKLEIEALPWDDITDKALSAIFYGWGVAEVMWRPDGERVAFDSIRVRDRARFRFDRDRNLYLWATGNGGFVAMPPRKFWTMNTGADNHDEPYGLGLAHALYWPVFFKRNDIKFWLIFLEKFGMPTALAKLPPGQVEDPKQRAKAIEMLRNIATDAGVVVPDNVVVELLEAARTGAADYGALHSAMDRAISKIVVGQTMTTDDGSSRAQAQVHLSVRQDIVEADADLLCGSFNAGPVKWWTEWNFPGAVPPKVWRRTEAPEDLTARAERDSKVYALGFEPTEEYIRETYGDGWQKKSDPIAAVADMIQGQTPDANTGAPPAEFAEGEPLALSVLRAARRADQQALFDAARMFAEQYNTITGNRVAQLLQAAEFSDDAETFRRRLDEILAEAPEPSMLDRMTRAFSVSRMLGALRNQRAK
jgi:phage gp29-like protein